MLKNTLQLLIASIALTQITEGNIIFNESFDTGQTVGNAPIDTSAISSSGDDYFSHIIDSESNLAGSGNGLRLFDNDSSKAFGVEYNTAINANSGISTMHISLDLAQLSDTGSSDYAVFTGGEYDSGSGMVLNSSAKRYFEVRLYGDGNLRFVGSSSQLESLGSGSNNIDIFINDLDSATAEYISPETGANITMASNSIDFYLNDTLSLQTNLNGSKLTLGGSLANTENNFGRIGTTSFSSTVGLDYSMDNILIDNFTAVPEPETYAAIFSILSLALVLKRSPKRKLFM